MDCKAGKAGNASCCECEAPTGLPSSSSAVEGGVAQHFKTTTRLIRRASRTASQDTYVRSTMALTRVDTPCGPFERNPAHPKSQKNARIFRERSKTSMYHGPAPGPPYSSAVPPVSCLQAPSHPICVSQHRGRPPPVPHPANCPAPHAQLEPPSALVLLMHSRTMLLPTVCQLYIDVLLTVTCM